MSYPGYVQTTACPKWEKADCDAITEHVLAGETVSGFLAYPYTYIVRALAGPVYDAIDSTGTRVYGGPDDTGGVNGASFDDVLAACIGSNRSIRITAATYSLTSTITLTSLGSCILDFEGEVTLNFNGAVTPCILIDGCSQCAIRSDGRIDVVNNSTATPRIMVEIKDSNYILLDHVYVNGGNAADTKGIYFYGSSGLGSTLCTVRDCRARYCANGIEFAGEDATAFVNCNVFFNTTVIECTAYGIYFTAMTHCNCNNFYGCNIGQNANGLYYASKDQAGNSFIGSKFDSSTTKEITLIADHRSLKLTDCIAYHNPASDLIDGSFAYGDHITNLTGQAYSEYSTTGSIANGDWYVDCPTATMWNATPDQVTITPTTTRAIPYGEFADPAHAALHYSPLTYVSASTTTTNIRVSCSPYNYNPNPLGFKLFIKSFP